MDTKEAIRDYWDYRCARYSTGVVETSGEEWAAWKQALETALKGRGRLKVLDVGTGPGILAMMLAELGHEVTGLDLSSAMLEKARRNAEEKGLAIDFRQGDAENLEFPDGTFDAVTSKFLLWTLPHPEKAMAEWNRVLKKQGVVIAIDGDWHSASPYIWSIRKLSEAVRYLKKDDYLPEFKKRYDPIVGELPLYCLKPGRVKSMLADAGYAAIEIQRMDDLCRSARKNGSLLDKLDYAYPIYFMKAEKQ